MLVHDVAQMLERRRRVWPCGRNESVPLGSGQIRPSRNRGFEHPARWRGPAADLVRAWRLSRCGRRSDSALIDRARAALRPLNGPSTVGVPGRAPTTTAESLGWALVTDTHPGTPDTTINYST